MHMTINSGRYSALENSHTEFREHTRRDAARPVNRIDQDQLATFLERDIGILLPVEPLRQKYLSAMRELSSVNEVMAAAAKAYYIASQLTSKAFIETYFPTTTGMGDGAIMAELIDFGVQVKVFVERLVPVSYNSETDEICVHVRAVSRPRDCPTSFYEFGMVITPGGYWRVRSSTKHPTAFNPDAYHSMFCFSKVSDLAQVQ